MIRLTIKPFMILALACAFSSVHAERIAPRNLQQEQQNLRLVENFYNRFFNQHDLNAAQVVAPEYKQHNPYVADGKQPFVDYFKEEFQKHPESKAKIVRHATQGDLVYLHVHSTENTQDRGQAVMDIFRVQHGKIVEHWDIVQDVPAEAANSNSMF